MLSNCISNLGAQTSQLGGHIFKLPCGSPAIYQTHR